MTDRLTIRKADSPADYRAFVHFPWVVYRDDPLWVPPLLSMRRDLLDRKKNPSWEYLDGDYFGAWRGERLVGTISAFINHRHNEFHDEHIGWFGTFEVLNDPEAARLLLDTAAEWVGGRGYEVLRGPQSFTTHEECGLLVEGFDRPPVLLTPYNPPYYADMIEAAGFHKVMDVLCFYTHADTVRENGLYDRLERLTKAVMKRQHITVRPVDPKNLKADFALFKELYNAGWEKNWGFVPMTPRELDALVESLGQFFDPRLAFFGYIDGQPGGFVLPIPNFNEVLQRAYPRPGEPEAFTLLKALWHWKVRPVITGTRTPLFGVKPEYRGSGLAAVLLFHGLRAILDAGFTWDDSGRMLETNQAVINIIESFGSTAYKRHRFYEKTL